MNADIQSVVQAVRISASNISILGGKPIAATTQHIPAIQSELYSRLYCRLSSPADNPDSVIAPAAAEPEPDSLWRLSKLASIGPSVLRRGADFRLVQYGEFSAYDSTDVPLSTGSRVRTTLRPAVHLQEGGGFWVYERGLNPAPVDQVRVYFNVDYRILGDLTLRILETLRRYELPLSYKHISNTVLSARPDAAVLYLTQRNTAFALPLVLDTLKDFSAHMRDGVPLFSRQVAAGISIAESPQSGESFGMSRCHICAEAVVAGVNSGHSFDEMFLSGFFEAKGYDLDNLWRNPGSFYPYSIAVAA